MLNISVFFCALTETVYQKRNLVTVVKPFVLLVFLLFVGIGFDFQPSSLLQESKGLSIFLFILSVNSDLMLNKNLFTYKTTFCVAFFACDVFRCHTVHALF